MSAPTDARRGGARELGRFLEIQNLGLNLPFALAFLFLAARGVPNLVTIALVVVAFVAARNAGHSFNRWVDRRLDAANPRTQARALPSGRTEPGVRPRLLCGELGGPRRRRVFPEPARVRPRARARSRWSWGTATRNV